MTLRIPVLYVPSFYGDIRLEPHKHDDNKTVLIAEKLSASEKIALAKLSETANKKGWFDSSRVKDKTFVMEAGEHILSVPLLKLQKSLVKLLKPGRTVVTAVKFTDGTMEEVREAKEVLEPDAIKDKPGKAATAAAAVAAPTRGCPEPDFVKAEIKARGVLEAFLSPDQMADFREHNRFMTMGATTGHRYMVTSRHAKDSLAKFHRSLYDLDENVPLCVHDYTVPAAEEMLALHVLLQVPGYEGYLRHLEN